MLECRRGLVSEKQPMRAPVASVVAALDQTCRRQLVDEAAERDRREVQRIRQFRLLDALATLQTHQHRPLGARRVEIAGALVGVGAQQARDVVESEADFAGR